MRVLERIASSIGFMQAVAVLLAAVVIGLALSAVQLSITFSHIRDDAIALSEDVPTLAEGGAAPAAWTLVSPRR
jgi:UPF0716 family protein affecting phage T7 exclusion